MYRKQFKPKNIYKFHATSRKAGRHVSFNKLKQDQLNKEIQKLIKEELKDVK